MERVGSRSLEAGLWRAACVPQAEDWLPGEPEKLLKACGLWFRCFTEFFRVGFFQSLGMAFQHRVEKKDCRVYTVGRTPCGAHLALTNALYISFQTVFVWMLV